MLIATLIYKLVKMFNKAYHTNDFFFIIHIDTYAFFLYLYTCIMYKVEYQNTVKAQSDILPYISVRGYHL